jgi:arylsulfatase A-like enzyme
MCSPTRAAFLTGRYQQRLGIERALPTDWHDRGIGSDENKEEITIAEYLSKAGYATGIFGKWHLGKHPSASPVHHGFDEFRGLMCGCGDYFTKIDRNGYKDWWHDDQLSFQKGYATEVITNNAVDFIELEKDNPFFLYVAYSAIHFPWQRAEDDTFETRREGEDFTSGYPGSRSKLGPHAKDEVPGVIQDMIGSLDEGVGRIMKALKEQGIDRNTLVFFTSDNGGYLSYQHDTWPSVSSNGPLKGQKGQLYEGGHRVPALAWWPETISPGSICHETVMTFDLLPTVLDLVGIGIPPEDSRNAVDGKSILSLLTKNKRMEPRVLFWRMGNQKAVRDGEWKMVIPDKDAEPELYNLKSDIGETENVASRFPQKINQLLSKLTAWEKVVDRDHGSK